MWKQMLVRRATLLMVAIAVALTWVQSGRTQTVCVVERGIDPLDVLNQSVRHNVWIVLDTSGSMSSDFGGGVSRLNTAKRVLDRLMMSELIDASGNPLVNWGFVNFAVNGSNADGCVDQFTGSQCVGLNLGLLENPPPCGGDDNREAIIQRLYATSPNGWTPNGISLDQISDRIVQDGYVSGLYPDQRNFVIIVTDGDDTCECNSFLWDGASPGQLRGLDSSPAYSSPISTGDDARAYNAGLKGKIAYDRMNPTPTDRATGELGSTFVIGLGLNAASRSRANHLAWEASGAAYNNPNALSALFADNEEELIQALKDAFARIGIPSTELTLGAPIVGSVKELIPQIPGLRVLDPDTSAVRAVTNDDILGDADPASYDLQDVQFARRLRADLKDNVLFTTSVVLPGFKGHLRAHNVYSVQDYETGAGTRTADYTLQFWDAGEKLRDRDPDTRTILFNTRADAPGDPLHEFKLGADFTDDQMADLLGVDQGFLSEIDGVGALTKADAAKMAVQVIRGYHLKTHPVTGTLYNNLGEPNLTKLDENNEMAWKLMDSANVGVTVVLNPPRSPDANPPKHNDYEYGTGNFPYGYYWEKLNRGTVVYLPTNGGMVHGFNAENGEELVAYIPDDALGDWPAGEVPGSRSNLKDLVGLIVAENNGIANHHFFLSASATASDVFLRSPEGDDQWHTVITFGRGKGGKFLTALDVSQMPDWTPGRTAALDLATEAAPTMLFNVGNREGITDTDVNGESYEGLGETWSLPIVRNVAGTTNPDQWVMFVGGGYGCEAAGTNEGQYLYVLKMEDGSVYRRFRVPNDPAASIDYNGLVAMPVVYNPHELMPNDDQDYAVRAYIGDIQGKIHKLDCSQPDPLSWSFTSGIGNEFYNVGPDQPITAPVAIFRDNMDVYVFAGTGGDARVLAPFKFIALLDENNASVGQLVWTYDLPMGERVHVGPAVGGETAFFASTLESLDLALCASQFSSTLFALGVTTGVGTFDLDTQTTGENESTDLGVGKVTGLFYRDEHLHVSRSGGIQAEGRTLILGERDGEMDLRGGDGSGTGTVQILVRGFRMSPF